MEPNESRGLSSYYHYQPSPSQPHHKQHAPTITPTGAAATPNTQPNNGIPSNRSESHPHSLYPHSVPSAVSSPLETVRKKRGRPRKYGTPEQAAAAKRLSSISAPRKEHSLRGATGADASSFAFTSFSKKSQLSSLGSTGQSFTLHIISVVAGEDVGQKIMVFMQQSKCEICILSASGSISNASLRQPATSGGSITYEGLFDILSLSGSYVRTTLGGRTGGMSICLSSIDGQIIGGGVGGPLTAAGAIQVIVGSFIVDPNKDMGAGVKGEASSSKLGSPIGGVPFSSLDFGSVVDHQDVGIQLLQTS